MFFNDTHPPELSTLSLHDALPIYIHPIDQQRQAVAARCSRRETPNHIREVFLAVNAQRWIIHPPDQQARGADRKSTRLNSSHVAISYAVFCLKKKKQTLENQIISS